MAERPLSLVYLRVLLSLLSSFWLLSARPLFFFSKYWLRGFNWKSIMATTDAYEENGKVVKFWIFWVLSFLPLMLATRSSVSRNNLEIKNHLKNLNKPYVKSIKSPDKDIIDCVPINRQPAFDNPLIKTHTIQMQPSFYPQELSNKPTSYEEPFTQLWQSNGRCPKGTIPIRRTSEEDLLRASSLQSYGKKTPRAIPNPNFSPSGQTNAIGHEYATRYMEGGKFYGAKAQLNAWNPSVQEAREFSLAQIWVLAGEYYVDLNTVETGWQVYPRLYGDNRTRLFAYWTRDAYKKTGCYNLLCSAFVQTSKEIALGASISPISSYNDNQYVITLLIFKDPESGHWWLYLGDKPIGYWPTTLFTHLRDVASTVEWGGEVVNLVVDGVHTKTEMGSGRFPAEGFKKAANFRNLQAVDESSVLRTPFNLKTHVTRSGCYDLKAGKRNDWGEFFFFGGPGRNPNCQ